MARLPIPNGDAGQWGQILNEFLRVEHSEDGSLRSDGSLATKAKVAHVHTASDITSGTVDIARIPTGATSTTVALGDHSHTVATESSAGFMAAADKAKLDQTPTITVSITAPAAPTLNDIWIDIS